MGTTAAAARARQNKTRADLTPRGLVKGVGTLVPSPRGDYDRIMVRAPGDTRVSVGYVSVRRAGLLLELLTSRLGDASKSLLKGTATRQNQTVLLVTERTVGQARELLALAAAQVKQ